MKIIMLLVGTLAVVCLASAGNDRSNAMDFVTIPLDARQSALGGAGSLIPGPGMAHLDNPALLAARDRNSFGGAFSSLSNEVVLAGAVGSYKLKNGIVLSPQFRYLFVGQIEGTDAYGDSLKVSVAPYSLDGGISVSYRWIPSFSTGVAVRSAYEFLAPELVGIQSESDAATVFFDGGIYFTPARTLALSAGFRNAGFFVKRYNSDHSELPSSVYTGIRYFTPGVTKTSLLIELEKEQNFALEFKPAIEIQLYREIVAFRVGTSFTTDDMSHFFDVIKGDSNEKFLYSKSASHLLTLGAGVSVPVQEKSIYLDFATKIQGDGMGPTLAVSGGFSF